MNITNLPADAGVLICGHGSRAKIAEQEFSLLASGLKQRYPSLKVEYGFLEYSAPNIHMALDRLLAQGVKQIYALSGMLFAVTHAQNDIPSVLTTYQDKHPGLTIEYGRELGLHPEMIAALQARVLEALGYHDLPAVGELYDTMFVLVGRGTSVTEANAEACKLTRIIAENLGFGWSETVYSGVTFPSVGRGLEMALKLGFKKIVVAPYFLFGGRLIDRIYDYVDKVAGENPEVQFIKADYLRDQSHVLNTFIERINETINLQHSPAAGQCGLMADFKARLARGEVDVHHHHAEYQPDPLDDDAIGIFKPSIFKPSAKKAAFAPVHGHGHGHSHSHGHSHEHSHTHSDGHEHSHGEGHGHSHAPYKHIGHPHGPRTMIGENVCCCFMAQFTPDIIAAEQNKPQLNGTPACKKDRRKKG